MSNPNFGLSVPTQRRLFAVHLTKTTDRPVRKYGGALMGWLVIIGVLFAAWVAL